MNKWLARFRRPQEATPSGTEVRNQPFAKGSSIEEDRKVSILDLEAEEDETRIRRKKRLQRRRSSNIRPLIRDLLSGEFLTQAGVTRNIPYLVFVSGLFLLYISMGYHFERIEREKMNALRKIEELNAEFKTLQADFEIRRHQSRLEMEMAERGLLQPKHPPHLLQADEVDLSQINPDM